MWFRNLLIYRLTQDIPLGAEALEAALAAKPAPRTQQPTGQPATDYDSFDDMISF